MSQFLIESDSKPFRSGRNRNRGVVLLYIREDILLKELKLHTHSLDIEGIFVDGNLRKTK